MSRKCEILDTLLQQRDEKIRVLKSDLVIADATREKLSTNVNILEDTVKSLRQKNMHFEGQLARSVDVCHLLKDEVTKFANELKESESALLKQGELLQNLKTECEAKRKVEQLHEASWTSQIQALESQLDIAKRARESQGQHHRQLMAELENQIAILQQQKKEDGEKFAQDFGRAAAREAELAEINRQLRRDLAVLVAQAKEKERTGKELQESEVSILAAAVDSYEQALKELGGERDSLESQHRALTSSVDSFKQALEDARWRSATLEQENSDLKAQLEGLYKKDILRSQGLSKRIESLEQVKTVYELTINELSESSVKANQGLSEQALKENKRLEEHIQELVRQRDELADRLRESLITREGEGWDRLQQAVESIGDLKKMVEMLEDERNKLQKARAADAVTIKVLKESCEVVQTEHQRQVILSVVELCVPAHMRLCLSG
jgi:chromosome segregation ATPase